MVGRIYFDEDFAHDDRRDAVRQSGFDLLTAGEAGMLGRTDLQHLAFAAVESRLLVTHNQADFAGHSARWLREGKHHSGICIARMEDWLGPGEVSRRLQNVTRTYDGGTADLVLYLSGFA